jgi:hypothetical protein
MPVLTDQQTKHYSHLLITFLQIKAELIVRMFTTLILKANLDSGTDVIDAVHSLYQN